MTFDCRQSVTSQQVMFVQQPQHTFAGGQGRVTILQPNGAVTTTTHGYPVAGQPAMYLPQQVPFQYYQKFNSSVYILKLCGDCFQLPSHALSI